MNKNEFINFFANEDKNLVLKIYEKIILAEKSGICIFSNEFYPPNLWCNLYNIISKFSLGMDSFGGFNDSERRMVVFYNYELQNYPLKLVKITNKSKFSKLEHKDYLGALMSLGIKREKLGDIIVKEDECYVAVCEEIYDYLITGLEHIGKSPCSIDEVTDFHNIPGPELRDEIVIATSYRLDSITSALTGVSRNKCLSMINSGKVLVNYVSEVQKDRIVPNNAIVTIRSYGKFKVLNTIGNSGSGRLKINIKKYV